jgi:DnaJ-class molecular chaperone
MNPYDVLELAHDTPFQEVRVKYFKIARVHHPDKFMGTDEEKRANEEYFKKVTVAYRKIETGDVSNFSDFSYTNEDIRGVWSSVEQFFNKPELWQSMKNIIKDTLKDVATKTLHKFHNVTVPLKMEEIYNEKNKKLRLFLTGVDEPVFVDVNAGDFPYKIKKCAILENGCEAIVTINFRLKTHKVYRHDDLFESNDLYADITITLAEYILGKRCCLEFLDGSEIIVNILPFMDVKSPILIENKGLRKDKGNLYVFVNIDLPDKKLWDSQNLDFKDKLLNSLNAICKNGK